MTQTKAFNKQPIHSDKDGYIHMPQASGLGHVDVDWDTLYAHIIATL